MNAIDPGRSENHYCSRCLGTRRFIVRATFEECPICHKQLQIVSPSK
ncbi:MAG: hypothetical protein HYR85_22215 [Planctomycetes bacterium]|nr:hypothetical protein [Planctomycetota bacterium]MBI3844560.1 hypothetical protein [Planctomycetota bacterium]